MPSLSKDIVDSRDIVLLRTDSSRVAVLDFRRWLRNASIVSQIGRIQWITAARSDLDNTNEGRTTDDATVLLVAFHMIIGFVLSRSCTTRQELTTTNIFIV